MCLILSRIRGPTNVKSAILQAESIKAGLSEDVLKELEKHNEEVAKAIGLIPSAWIPAPAIPGILLVYSTTMFIQSMYGMSKSDIEISNA